MYKRKVRLTVALDKELLSSLKSAAKDLGISLDYLIETNLKEERQPVMPGVYDNIFKDGKFNLDKELLFYMENIREDVGLPVVSQIEMVKKGYYIVK